jgi:hypothetical protein
MNTKVKEEPYFEPVGLIGQYFHSLDDQGQVEWQGVVIGCPEPGWYYLQLFEWTMGEPNVRRLVKFEDMTTWLFYEDADCMKFSYEYGSARAGGPYRKEAKEYSNDINDINDKRSEKFSGLFRCWDKIREIEASSINCL